MRFTITLFFTLCFTAYLFAQQHVMVDVQSNFFSPADLTITAGDTVTWTNGGGFHNVNGTLTTYPDNPEGFGNGGASSSAWTYQHVFTLPGVYDYQCDPHTALGMVGTITVEQAATSETQLILTAVFDGPLPGGLPKGVELYAIGDISDLSQYGIGSATNGGGSDGEEYTFPATALSQGDFIYLTANEEGGFVDFFGFEPDFVDDMGNSVNINGNDAIELFFNGEVVDLFGDIDTDGSGEPWEYQDGWAYRVSGTGPDGTAFVLDNWIFSGVNALDNETSNATADIPVPIFTYTPTGMATILANNDIAATAQDMAVTIDVLANDQTPNGLNSISISAMPTNGMAATESDNTVTYTPDAGFCGGEDSFDYEICDADACDTATVTITVNCPTSYPVYTIGAVTTVDADGVADSLDVTCELRGIVHGVNLRGNGLQFTLIDESGDGIGVFNNSDDFGYTVNEGDELVLRGEVDQFNGLTQIFVEELEFVSADNPLSPTTDVTALDESTESQLIRLADVTLVDPGAWDESGASFNVDVTDGSNTYTVRVDNSTTLAGTMSPGDQPFNLTGIGGQFDPEAPFLDGYQILPRYIADLDIISRTLDRALGASIEVFPNPAREQVQINLGTSVQKLSLRNTLGQEMQGWFQLEPGTHIIPVQQLSPGLYTLVFRNGDSLWTEKLIVR